MLPRDSSRYLLVLVALALLPACERCGGGGTVTAAGELVLHPETLDFGLRTVGARVVKMAEVENLGRASA